jgi:mono/diheme cytochrome c family protein
MKAACSLLLPLLWLAGLAWSGLGWAQVGATDPLQLGRSLYRGTQAFAAPARLGQLALPNMACANCHGVRGEGRREAGIDAPPLQWRRLLAARDASPAFVDEAAIAQAIEANRGRQGQSLLAPMPQFFLTPQERTALLAYLRVLGSEAEPVVGVSADLITLGSVLPLSGARAALGRAIQAALQARLAEVNRNGGVFGRQLVLRVADAGSDGGHALQALNTLLDGGVFAVLASLVPGNPDELARSARSQGVPLVATLGVPLNDSADAYLTYLLPSLVSQSRQLLNTLARDCSPVATPKLVLYAPEPRLRALAQQLQVDADGIHIQPVADAVQIQRALAVQPTGTVIGLLPPGLAKSLRQQWSAHNAAGQCLGTLAVLSGNPPHASSAPVAQAIARQPLEVSMLPMSPLTRAATAVPLTEAQIWPFLADTAVQIFVESAARTGRLLDTPGFLQALASLRSYTTASGLSVSFSEKQHHGLNVAYLWRGDDHESARQLP